MDLFFYDVDVEYVKHLKRVEIDKRGFTRVPDIEYQNEKKMVCGVVLEINGFKYYVPVSSYKTKQANNILIRLEDDKFNQVKGSLRFNYMFPVDDKWNILALCTSHCKYLSAPLSPALTDESSIHQQMKRNSLLHAHAHVPCQREQQLVSDAPDKLLKRIPWQSQEHPQD